MTETNVDQDVLRKQLETADMEFLRQAWVEIQLKENTAWTPEDREGLHQHSETLGRPTLVEVVAQFAEDRPKWVEDADGVDGDLEVCPNGCHTINLDVRGGTPSEIQTT